MTLNIDLANYRALVAGITSNFVYMHSWQSLTERLAASLYYGNQP
jgi:hypothetical protein